MNDYEFKVVLSLNTEKIASDGEYDLDDIYKIIREIFAEKKLRDISQGSELIFVSERNDENGYGHIGLLVNKLYDTPWLRPYIKTLEWHDSDDGRVEDVLKIRKAADKKRGKQQY